MIPQINPKKNLNQLEVIQKEKMFPAVSTTTGRETRINVLVLGTDTEEKPLMKGQIQVPIKNPKQIPKQRAQTARGCPKTEKQREGI